MRIATPHETQGTLIAAIRARGDLLSLAQEATGGRMRPMGGEHRGPCPLHGGKGPNFSVNAVENVFHCFVCGAGGDIFEFVKLWRGISFPQALEHLTRRTGVSLGNSRAPITLNPAGALRRPSPAEKRRLANRAVLQAVREQGCSTSEPGDVYDAVQSLLALGESGAAYLASRGFDPAVAQHYGFRSIESPAEWAQLHNELEETFMQAEIGLAGLHRLPWNGEHPALLIPYVYRGQTIGLRFRSLIADVRKESRYRDLADARPVLPFNATALDAAGVLHIVEGELNALSLANYDLRVVGLPGAGAWREEWTSQIRAAIGSEGLLVVWYDDDEAGERARAALATSLVNAYGLEWLDTYGRAALLRGGDANDFHRAGALRPMLEMAGVL